MRGYVRDTAYHSQGGNISKELNLSEYYRNHYVLDSRSIGKGVTELGGSFRITYEFVQICVIDVLQALKTRYLI